MSEKTNQVEKYCIFVDAPGFVPMMNPKEMLQYGIHNGCIFNTQEGISVKELWKAKELLQGIEYTKLYSLPDPKWNYYKVEAYESFDIVHGVSCNSRVWFEWYLDFYYGARNPTLDKYRIRSWKETILWAFSKHAPITKNIDQMLLHYAWNPGWRPHVLGWEDNGK